MGEIKVIKVKQSVLANNDARAEILRKKLEEKGVFFVNVMSSPGSGKTTLLVDLINRMKDRVRIGVIEADMDAFVDASKVAELTGVKTLQINTSGECHLDAKMTSEAIDTLGVDDLDLVILENIGNLVCPAEFDTGANMNLVLLSVPEGDDKPIKYPLMFERADTVVFTKMDTAPYFDFNLELCVQRIRVINRSCLVFPVSAKTGSGMDRLANYLLGLVE